MDLGAFQNIEALYGLAKDNGIDIPRCRGYRLMKDEAVITQAEIDKLKRINAIYITELLIDSDPFWCGSDEYADICIPPRGTSRHTTEVIHALVILTIALQEGSVNFDGGGNI